MIAQPSPTKNPLLRMLWCESVAPLGKPVVPLVYWMLIGSLGVELGLALGQRVVAEARRRRPAARSQPSVSKKTARSSVSTAGATSATIAS